MELDEDISTYLDVATLTQKQVAQVSDSDVSEYFLLTHRDLQDLTLLLIATGKILHKQRAAPFYRNLVAKLQNDGDVSSTQNEDGTSFQLAYGDEQCVLLEALQARKFHIFIVQSGQGTTEVHSFIVSFIVLSTRRLCL